MTTTPSSSKIRVLIADDEMILSQHLCEFLNQKGFEARHVSDGAEVRKTMEYWQPKIVLYDLMLPDLNALAFMKAYAASQADHAMKVIVVSGHNNPANVKECMRLGASDYISRPLSNETILAHVVLQLQRKHEIAEVRTTTPGASVTDAQSAQYFMHLTDLVLREALKGLPIEDSLHNLMGLVAMALKAVRVSVIKCDPMNGKGYVIAASDNRLIAEHQIDLHKYPEVVYVLNTEKPLAISSLSNDETLHFVTKISKTINFNAMIVVPIRMGGELGPGQWGVLSVRLPDTKATLSEFEIRWAQLVSHVAALIVARSPALTQPFPVIAVHSATS